MFICHRKTDASLARKLAKDIEAAGHTVWFDEWNITTGDSIVGRIAGGLEGTSYLILCYSSSGSSEWTDREWMSTLARQLSGNSVRILPVLLTGGSPPAILADIRYADLVSDWAVGMAELLAAIK